MSVLNLALQNVSLSRIRMEDHSEAMVKNKNTLSDLRKILEDSELRHEYQASMDGPIKAVTGRFQAMKLKDESVVVGVPATDDDITDMVQHE